MKKKVMFLVTFFVAIWCSGQVPLAPIVINQKDFNRVVSMIQQKGNPFRDSSTKEIMYKFQFSLNEEKHEVLYNNLSNLILGSVFLKGRKFVYLYEISPQGIFIRSLPGHKKPGNKERQNMEQAWLQLRSFCDTFL